MTTAIPTLPIDANTPPIARISMVHDDEVIVTGTEALFAWRKHYEMPVPGHEFHPRFRRGAWDGRWAPGTWCKQRGWEYDLNCSRGLLPRLFRDLGLQEATHVTSQEDIEQFMAEHEDIFTRLRDYQCDAFVTTLRAGWGRVAYATNAGKGAVIALLALFAAEYKREPALILCDELAVFDALKGEVAQWAGVEPMLVKSGVKTPPPTHDAKGNAHVAIAMIPTLARRLAAEKGRYSTGAKNKWRAWCAEMRMVLLDEADKSDNNTWRAALKAAHNSRWRLGFSGTFSTELYKDLRYEELMGPIVARVSNAEMVERGVSARPIIEVHGFDVTAAVAKVLPHNQMWWDMTPPARRAYIYACGIIHNQARHDFLRSLIRPDTPTVLVVTSLDHGRELERTIPDSIFLDGSSSMKERIAVLERFARREVLVIIVTKILDRGSNRLKDARDLIFASGEGSVTQTLQRLGRGLRKTDGKDSVRVVDVADRINTVSRDKKLLSAASFVHAAVRKRLEVYGKEGFDIRIERARATA